MKKSYRMFFALILCVSVYIINFSKQLPDEITIFSGQPNSPYVAGGIKLDSLPESMEVSAEGIVAYDEGEFDARLSAFGVASRRINLRVIEPVSVRAGGNLVGIKLRGAGVIVIGFDKVYSGNVLREGDIILSVNERDINSYRDFAAEAQTGQSVRLRVERDGEEFFTELTPALCDDGQRRLGIWVRDSAAGVGTLTFADNNKKIYGALGHGINETDTGVRFPVRKGTIERSVVAGVTKGQRGVPGEITGAFLAGEDALGTIESNSDCGIFGRLLSEYSDGEEYSVALAGEVRVGEAEIICNVGEGRSRYKINIMRVNRLGNATKGILLEITDPRLLELTGGIIQGMSGSPIIQNEKLVGAVTHVLVNNPACGYGVFLENMLAAAESVG